MKVRVIAIGLLGGAMVAAMAAQTPKVNDGTMQDDAVPTMPGKGAKTFALRSHVMAKPAVRGVALTPLSARDRVVQVLDRFTFGPTPGAVDRVLAVGEDKWVERQMNPGTIKDTDSVRALAQFPSINMNVPQLLLTFPDRAQIGAVADGKVPYPTDPLLNGVYEVQVAKLLAERDQRKADGTAVARVDLTDAQKAEKKKMDQATAARVAGELFALPNKARMDALIKMPVADRIAFTGNGNLPNEQRYQLLADFTPREREAFEAMSGQVSSSYRMGYELAEARITRDILTQRQLQEVMTDFWFNHFNVYVQKGSDQWYTPSYERDVIRKNALGTFHDLLLATAESPAMMVYLDNWISIGPDSMANGVNPNRPGSKKGARGLNENYGREVMELHTVGVNGGYTQADVTTLSSILTGWGVERPNQGGGFAFDPRRHEPGPKTWFGYTIDDHGNVTPADKSVTGPAWGPTKSTAKEVASPDSMKQGIAALDILASSPKTAHFISYLLAQRFVADDPPPALVDRLNFAYQLTNDKFANQKFDAPKLLAMGLLAPTGTNNFAALSKQVNV
ncbi:MAG: DUF1800 domain-containing protein, partial [Bryocella sp.]